MTNLVIDDTKVNLVRGSDEVLHTGPMAEAGTAGQYFRLNTTTGKLEKGNATTAPELGTVAGILLRTVPTVNMTGTIVKLGSKAWMDLGDAVSGMAFDAAGYVSDTDATLADSVGTVSRVAFRVIPGWNATTADKIIELT